MLGFVGSPFNEQSDFFNEERKGEFVDFSGGLVE